MSAVPAGIVPVVPRAGLDPSFDPPPGATCLSEESRTYLLDGTVYRPRAPWTPSVHALLRHLEAVGYRGAPRLMGRAIEPAIALEIVYPPVDGPAFQVRRLTAYDRTWRGTFTYAWEPKEAAT